MCALWSLALQSHRALLLCELVFVLAGFLAAIFKSLVDTGVVTAAELLAWRADESDESPGRLRALDQVEELLDGLTA